MKISASEGEELVNIAKSVIKAVVLKTKLKIPVRALALLEEPRGVFVTITRGGKLRGCIGFPEPIFPLGVALIRAAKGAATQDQRFPPISKEELKDLKVEVTVLTPPKKIEAKKPEDYLKKIKIGSDGLIVKKNGQQGLLLPQVPVEHNWGAKEFLEHTCIKAGLAPDAWLDTSTEIYKFQGQVFKED